MQKQRKKVLSTQKLVYMAVLVAMQVVLTRFLSIPLSTTKRLSFAYVPIVFSAFTMGPVAAAVINGVADFVGAILFPSGPFFPGFTLTAVISGLIYGFFLYRKDVKWYHILLARGLVVVFCHWGLNSLWLSIMYGRSFFISLPVRMIPDLIQFPLDMIVLFALNSFVHRLPAKVNIL